MLSPKKIVACLALMALCAPASVHAQPAPPPASDVVKDAIKQYPILQKLDPSVAAMLIAACLEPDGKLNAGKLQAALQQCPAFNGNPGSAPMAEAAKKCPAFNGAIPQEKRKCPAWAQSDPTKCPAFMGQPGFNGPNGKPGPGERKMARKGDARMQSVAKNLERNKRSADALIQAAREAGAPANVLADLEKMSEAFRQVFMSTVPPEKIVESIFTGPQPPEAGQGLIIIGPDGSRWLVTPGQMPAPEAKPAPAPRPGAPAPMQPAPQGLPSFGKVQPAPGAPGAVAPRSKGLVPGSVPPPPGMMPPPGMALPQGGVMQSPPPPPATPQGPNEVIIMEEGTLEPMPMWPTKDHLGKDGVLKYLEKREALMRGSAI